MIGYVIFEVIYGIVLKYVGLDKVNLFFVFFLGVLLLEYLGWNEVVKLVIVFVEKIIVLKVVIYDFVCLMEGVIEVKCFEFVNEFIKNMDVVIIKNV